MNSKIIKDKDILFIFWINRNKPKLNSFYKNYDLRKL